VLSWSIQPFGCNRHGPKIWGSAPFLERGTGSPILHKVAWAEAYLPTKWNLDPCIYLAQHIWATNWRAVPLCRRGAGSPSNNNNNNNPICKAPECQKTSVALCGQGLGIPARQVSSLYIQPFGHSTPTSHTGQTDRQTDRTDNGDRANRFTNGRKR